MNRSWELRPGVGEDSLGIFGYFGFFSSLELTSAVYSKGMNLRVSALATVMIIVQKSFLVRFVKSVWCSWWH